jgi:hypothetical protein
VLERHLVKVLHRQIWWEFGICNMCLSVIAYDSITYEEQVVKLSRFVAALYMYLELLV